MTVVVDAQPTKEFFVLMLVKDIDLVAAICDLIDNSVDAARELRPKGNLSGLYARLMIEEARFSLTDNCGGMTVKKASTYAFRFGRPDEAGTPAEHSIGLFGVGMKRALFKLGTKFVVQSDDGEEAFEIKVDVPKWLARNKWEFSLVPSARLEEPGTVISVTGLFPGISEQFALEKFRTDLATEIGRRHQAFIGRGLELSINGKGITGREPSFREPAGMTSAYVRQPPGGRAAKLATRIYCGLSERSPRDAGWYVFCNDRLVLGPDKSDETGWGVRRGLPRYHNQYAHFRGYVFFDSDDPRLLPWNTTKMGLDLGAPAYRAARNTMFTVMQPVIKYLNDVKAVRGEDKLEESIDRSPVVKLNSLKQSDVFVGPRVRAEGPGPELQKIQYWKPVSAINRVKRALGVTTLTAVGEETFDYFYSAECDDE
jgi:hypothetical protein